MIQISLNCSLKLDFKPTTTASEPFENLKNRLEKLERLFKRVFELVVNVGLLARQFTNLEDRVANLEAHRSENQED